jgi:hypothetical protein
MNTVKLDSLKTAITPNLKNPVVIFSDNINTIRGSILLENLTNFNKTEEQHYNQGNSIFLRSNSTTGKIKLYHTANPTTNIVSYRYTDDSQTYNYTTDSLTLTYPTSNTILKESHISVENASALNLEFISGNFCNLDVTSCPSLKNIKVTGENCIHCNVVDIRPLFNLQIFECLSPGNTFEYIIGFSKKYNKSFVIHNASMFKIFTEETSDILHWILEQERLEEKIKYYFTAYDGENFTELEQAWANTKNIELINVR